MVFGAAAWKVAVRDRFISWSVAQRQQRLGALANQQRFLILPWVRVAHLVSHLLARATRRLSADWEARYGHPVWLVKTFVSRTVLPARPTKPRVGYPWDRLPGGPGRIASEPCIAPSNQSGCERSTPLFAPT